MLFSRVFKKNLQQVMVVLQHAASCRKMQLHVIHMLTVIIKSDVHYSIAPSIVAMFLVLFNVDSRLWGMPILPEIAIGQKRGTFGCN